MTEMLRWSRRSVLLGSLGCLLAACSTGQAGTVAYSLGVSGDGNSITLVQESSPSQGRFVATVQSERGFGQASIGWWGKPLPHHLVFRLQLRGLEQFSLVWAERAVHISVNSTDHSVIESTQLRGEEDTEITPDSAYWMDVVLPTQERPVYLVSAPAAFIVAAPSLWAISWIDFYR